MIIHGLNMSSRCILTPLLYMEVVPLFGLQEDGFLLPAKIGMDETDWLIASGTSILNTLLQSRSEKDKLT